MEDWELLVAGQRVQIIKKDEQKGGILEFGTEIVSASDGSIAALLGASPGASTAVDVMLKLIERCFPDLYYTKKWQDTFETMIPSFGKNIVENSDRLNSVQIKYRTNLGLK
jgi:malate dehydrogenase (quinone)